MNKRAGSVPPVRQWGSTVSDAHPDEVAGAPLFAAPIPASNADSSPAPAPGPVPGGRGVDDTEPSWGQVIATTVRLWVQRHGLAGGGRGAGGGPGNGQRTGPGGPRRLRRRIGAFGLVVVVFAAGALAIALAQSPASRSAGKAHRGSSPSASTTKLNTAGLAAAQQNRRHAAAWIVSQVSHATIVSCDQVMCAALQAAGYPAGDLLALSASATDPMGSQLVAATPVLRNQLGSRLPDVYAPVVIASFGIGATRVDVRIEAPDGTRAYLISQKADQDARVSAGRQLLRNSALHVTGTARDDITAGRVDDRLLVTLAALTSQGRMVYLDSFSEPAPGASPSVPLRTMLIAIPGGREGTSYRTSVLTFLRAQQALYRASATVVRLPGSNTAIQIRFTAPSPLGLLGAGTSP